MSKETLAKLMAIEDINVENRKVPTAAFDLKSRTLILPIWKDDLSISEIETSRAPKFSTTQIKESL